MRRPVLLSIIAIVVLLLATFLSSSTAQGLQEPPPPQPGGKLDVSDPRGPDERYFDPRLIGPGWLESEGSLEAFPVPKSPEGPPLNAVKVVSGFNHSCVLTDLGGVRCWGDNYLGQLGDGTRIFRTTPVDVVGLTSGVIDISSTHNHTCALTLGGGVRCWGYNLHGELGNGNTTNSLVPVEVYGLQENVITIAAGGFHTCVRMEDISVKCWGANWHGQVGDGTTYDRYLPVEVDNLESGTLRLTAGKFHTCAVTINSDVKCWGYNKYGQQGNGSTTDNHIPRKAIALGAGVRDVYAGGLHTCAWTLDNKLKCWGNNSEGQLAIGGISQSVVPMRVLSLNEPPVWMSLGASHTCGITIEGGVKCWGNNWAGQLGNLGTMTSSWPSDVVNLPDVVNSLASGDSHTCATTADGTAHCWGSNGIGQLGKATTGLSLEPVDVVDLNASTSNAGAGVEHACAVTNAGGVKCWGSNKFGQLGDGTFTDRVNPVDVDGLTEDVIKVESGYFHSCAILAGGGLKCWGANSDGQLGDGTTEASGVPVFVANLAGVVDVSAGSSHTCAITFAGGVKCWGKNSRGRLGDGTTIQRLTPVDVYGQTSGVVALEVGGHHSCILKDDGAVRCWGSNTNGQIGDGTAADRWTPVVVSGLGAGVVTVTAGDGFTCALFDHGGASCWGANYSGQLGDGSMNTRYLPGGVSNLPGQAIALEAGAFHTCAVLSGGSTYCWGDNWNGQLGDGSTTERLYPTEVSTLQTGVSELIGGFLFTCGLMNDGSLKCWGAGGHGQLGNGVLPWEPAPVNVVGLTPASLAINYHSGQAGSYFHITGEDFLPESTAEVSVNGFIFSQVVTVDANGSFGLNVSTDQADNGNYFLSVDGILRAMTIFHLSPEAPLLPQEGNGILLNLPPGISFDQNIFIPIGYRWP